LFHLQGEVGAWAATKKRDHLRPVDITMIHFGDMHRGVDYDDPIWTEMDEDVD